jgi:hypothetical protein
VHFLNSAIAFTSSLRASCRSLIAVRTPSFTIRPSRSRVEASFNDPERRCDQIYFNNWSGFFADSQIEVITVRYTPGSMQYILQPTNPNLPAGVRNWSSEDGRISVMTQTSADKSGRHCDTVSIWTRSALDRAARVNNPEPILSADELPSI